MRQKREIVVPQAGRELEALEGETAVERIDSPPTGLTGSRTSCDGMSRVQMRALCSFKRHWTSDLPGLTAP